MKVKELIKELKQYPQDAMVFVNNNWDAIDENGHFTDLKEVYGVCDDVVIVDSGLDFEDEHHIIFDA